MNPARALLWQLFRPYRGQAALALLLLLLSAALYLALPQWSGTLIRDILSRDDLDGLARHLGLGLLIVGAASGFAFLRDHAVYRIVHRVAARLREQLFEHVLSLPLPRLARTSSGELITRFSSEIEALQQGLSAGLTLLLPGVVLSIVFLAAMFVISWRLSLATVLLVVPLVLAIGLFERQMRKRSHEARSAVARLMSFWAEILRGMREMKSFVREAAMGKRLADALLDALPLEHGSV